MKKWFFFAAATVLSLSITSVSAHGVPNLKAWSAEALNKEVQLTPEPTATPVPKSAPTSGVFSTMMEKLNEETGIEIVEGNLYLDDEIGSIACVMLEAQNISGEAFELEWAAIEMLDADGNVLDCVDGAEFGPSRVEKDESLFIWIGFYDLGDLVDEIESFDVIVQPRMDKQTRYSLDAKAVSVKDGMISVLVENTVDKTIYEIEALAVVKNDEGRILDICRRKLDEDIGIPPGGTIKMQMDAERYINGSHWMDGNVTVYVTYSLQ